MVSIRRAEPKAIASKPCIHSSSSLLRALSPQYWRIMFRHISTVHRRRRIPPSLAQHARRNLTLQSAERLLGLTDNPRYTPRELRDAYFDAAKSCHPDSTHEAKTKRSLAPIDAARHFLEVTEAYELLRSGRNASFESDANFVTKSEEQEFREACKEWLGLDAETVEESKRCPLFREWLQGGTDAACHWNNFFFLNGGLVPKLRPAAALIGEGSTRSSGPNRRRRR